MYCILYIDMGIVGGRDNRTCEGSKIGTRGIWNQQIVDKTILPAFYHVPFCDNAIIILNIPYNYAIMRQVSHN
jgi:hypothetical protein